MMMYQPFPRIRYAGMTMLELHYLLQVFCVHQEDGGGVNGGSSEIVKGEFW